MTTYKKINGVRCRALGINEIIQKNDVWVDDDGTSYKATGSVGDKANIEGCYRPLPKPNKGGKVKLKKAMDVFATIGRIHELCEMGRIEAAVNELRDYCLAQPSARKGVPK